MEFFYGFLLSMGVTIVIVFIKRQIENYIDARKFEKSITRMIEIKNREWNEKLGEAIKKSFEDERVKKIWIDYWQKQTSKTVL